MFADLLDLAGWDAYQVGGNVPLEAVLSTVVDRKPDLLAISATLAPSIPAVAEAVLALRADPRSAGVPILVGGSAFLSDPALALRLGADAYAPDADAGVAAAERLVSGSG